MLGRLFVRAGGAVPPARTDRDPGAGAGRPKLASSNPAVARVPQETVVNANTATSTFNLATSAVSTSTPVAISATWFGVIRTTTITVTPGQPPATDVVRITKATWKKGLLTIEATSTNPNAILTVFSSSGSPCSTSPTRAAGDTPISGPSTSTR